MTLTAPAKVNVALDILGRDEKSGYHFVDTVVYKLPDLFDTVVLEPAESISIDIKMAPEIAALNSGAPDCEIAALNSGAPDCKIAALGSGTPDVVPTDEKNTIWNALTLLGEEKWKVHVAKRIPTRSGLGGGSSDAAAVIRYIGELRGLSDVRLMEVARTVGMDVPLFLTRGNVVHCTHFGEVVVNDWEYGDLGIEVFDSGVGVSTETAYAGLDIEHCGLRAEETFQLLAALREGKDISSFIHNDFEIGFFKDHPGLKKEMGNLCGSGGWMYKLKSEH